MRWVVLSPADVKMLMYVFVSVFLDMHVVFIFVQ